MKTLRFCVLVVCVCALPWPAARGQAAENSPQPLEILSGRPDATGEELLGGTYQNPLAGIAFRIPSACDQVAKVGSDEVARFASTDRWWEMVVTKATSAQPLPLSEQPPAKEDEPRKLGLLEVVAARLRQSNPSIEIVRQDTVDLGEFNVGIIAARMTVGSQRRLLQQAIVQANEQLYYTIALTTPASKEASGADSDDPGERVAAETFRQVLDTVKLLDRSPIKDDQNERLFRTRAFFVGLNGKRMREVLVPEQWLRLMHDGRDVGYTYIVEEPDATFSSDGVKIGIRSRSYPEPDVQVDGETWYHVSGDRHREKWSNLVWMQNHKSKSSEQFTEFGTSSLKVMREVDEHASAGDPKDPKQPALVKTGETYNLRVQTGPKTAPPVTQELPPWYLPQAAGHLLPRLLPLNQPKTFMFATYISDSRAVMHRYVDVGTEQEVELAGKRVRAVPISDRVGLEGSPTIHYISLDGKYLGSVNKDSKITLLPTDAVTLQKLWSNKADLTRPAEREQQPEPGPAAQRPR